jgi:hypothetical protein
VTDVLLLLAHVGSSERTHRNTLIYQNTFIYCTYSQIDLNLLWGLFGPCVPMLVTGSTVKTFRGLMEDDFEKGILLQ